MKRNDDGIDLLLFVSAYCLAFFMN